MVSPWSCAAHRAQGQYVVGLGKSRQAAPGHLLLSLRAAFWALFLLSPGPGHHPPLISRSAPCPEVYWFLVEKLKLAHG